MDVEWYLLAFFGDGRQSIDKNMGSELSDAKLADLLPSAGTPAGSTLATNPNKPVFLEAIRVHSVTVIDHDDRSATGTQQDRFSAPGGFDARK